MRTAQKFSLSLVLSVVSISLATAANWPFNITPQGEPNVKVELISARDLGFVSGLSIQHELIFDGVRYRSRVLIPELQSHLISDGPTGFIWRPFGARPIRIPKNPSNYQDWTISEIGTGHYRIESGDLAQFYEFVDCRPIRAVIGGTEYTFVHERGLLLRISKAETAIVSVEYRNGSMTRINAAGRDIALKCDDEGRIVGCVDSGFESPLNYTYKNELLSSFELGESKQHFEWAEPSFGEYGIPPVPVPPMVAEDNQFRYESTLSAGVLRIQFQGKNDARSGRWEFHWVTGRLRVAVKNQQ